MTIERSPAVVESPSAPATGADARVRDLHRLVDSGDYDLLSLDVFDTLVWRMVPTPPDVFFLVARALVERGALHESSSPESFVQERIKAEERARRKSPGLEATLEGIYAEFPRGYLARPIAGELPGIEFQIEKRLVRVHPEMRGLLSHAQAAGLEIALVSDTYFSRAQIEELAGVTADFVILSCEHGVSKFGGLHRVLLDRSGIAPERILHAGDSYRADVEGPAVFNVARYWFRKFPDRYRDLVRLEMPSTQSRRADCLPSHDCGLTALRSRAMFACATEYERWGAGILGPVVAGFCDWVIDRCRQIEATSLLCLMREGRILKRAIDAQGGGLEAAELFVSRYTALKSAIFDGSEEELAAFVLRPSPQKLGKILRQLGLEPGDLPDLEPAGVLTSSEAASLIRRIAADRSLRRKVVRSSARARAGLLAHLQSRLPGRASRTVAVVDLGYRGTIQECLQRISDRERLGLGLHGLYLVTGGEVHLTQSAGAAAEGWLAENGQPIAMAHTFMRSPEIVEQSLMADCGTTLGHTEDGEPILDREHTPGEQREQIAEIQRGVLGYVTSWAAHKAEHALTDTAHLGELYRAILIRSVARPLEVELDLFAGWRHDENLGSESTRTLTRVSDLHEWELAHLSAHQLASLPHTRVYWPFGLAWGISRNMGEAVASIFLRSVAPEAFNSGSPPRPMVFYWDSGKGFGAETSSILEYALNNRGNAWQRISLEVAGGAHRRYGITLGVRGEVLQLTGIRTRHRDPRGAELIEDFPHQAIEKVGYRHLCGNLYAVTEDTALLVIPGGRDPGFGGVVDIDLFFSIVPAAVDREPDPAR